MTAQPTLIRREALKSRTVSPFGKILCIGPVTAYIWSLLFFVIVLSVILFLCFGQYQPEIKVTGVLAPDKGLNYIYAPEAGTVEQLAVAENITLQKNTNLFSIQVSKNRSGILPSEKQLDLLANQIQLMQNTLNLHKNQLKRLQKLKDKKAISEATLQEQQQLVFTTEISLKQLQQKYLALKEDRHITLKAPVAGKLVSLLVTEGADVLHNQPLAVIIPENSKLEAHLFVTSNQMRFINIGQKVHLTYSAYPWQQYGIHEGIVSSIGNILIEPGQIKHTKKIEQSFFLIKVKMLHTSIKINKTDVQLKPDMQCSASLLLPYVTLWHWIFSHNI